MPSRLDGPGIAAVSIGALLAFAGFKGYSVLQATQNIVQGKHPDEGQNISALTAGNGGSAPTGPVGKGGTPEQNKAAARLMLASFGWGQGEFASLDALWTGESGWSQYAENKSSGAYGIAQALPETKYPMAGRKEGGSNPIVQMRWGMSYIKHRPGYGTPSNAYRMWLSRNPHWY